MRGSTATGSAGIGLAPPRYGVGIVDAVGHGERLPHGVRATMERSFGADFSGVRIHRDAAAASIHARAFTRGSDIHFAPGHYDPHTDSGRALIGHELAHVVQQSRGEVGSQHRHSLLVNGRLEQKADEQGARAARGERVGGGLGTHTAALAAPASSPIQAAFIAKRAVGSMASIGLPAMGVLHHVHIVFEDGEAPPNWGFMGADKGLGQDVIDERYNSKGGGKVQEGLEDGRMRRAVAEVDRTGDFTKEKYRLLTNNCQHYVDAVMLKYAELDPNRKPVELALPPPKDKGSNDDPRNCKVSDCAIM